MLRAVPRWLLVVVLGAVIIVTQLLSGTQTALAQSNVSTDVNVDDTTLHISGWTSPGAYVTVRRDGNVVASLLAGSDGIYDTLLPAQSSGIADLAVSAIDADGTSVDIARIQANVLDHARTDVSLFLPPSVIQDMSMRSAGQPLNLKGRTYPGSKVYAQIAGQTIATTVAARDGTWQITVRTVGLAAGSYSYTVQSLSSDGNQSYATTPRTFTIQGLLPLNGQHTVLPLKPVEKTVEKTGPISSLPEVSTSDQAGLRAILLRPAVNGTAGKPVTLDVTVDRGEPPFRVTVAWGDHTSQTYSDKGVVFNLSHSYPKPGRYTGKITIANSLGETDLTFTMNIRAVRSSPLLMPLPLIIIGIILILTLIRRTLKKWSDRT